MFFSTFLVSTFATLALASPLERRQTAYSVSDVLASLNSGKYNGPAFCSSLLSLSPSTVTSTKTKTIFTKSLVSTTTYQETTTSTLTGSTALLTDFTAATSTDVVTVTDDTLIVTIYQTPAPQKQKRSVPQDLKKFPTTLLSSGCSSYISTTSTKTAVATTTIYPTTTKTRTFHKKVLKTQVPVTTITTTATITVSTNAFTGVEATITATSTLTAGQSAPTVDAGNSIFSPIGCYSEGKGGRALQFIKAADDIGMTVADCIGSYCQGYKYAGLEYGRECWCGNTIMFNAAPVDAGDCSSECTGDSTEFCGNNHRLSMYQSNQPVPPNAYIDSAVATYMGCYAEPPTSSGQRALVYEFTDDVNESMTAESCLNICKTNNYSWAGVEYGRECWCDNSLNSLATQVDDNQCSFSCEGNAVEQCGGSSVLNLYQLNAQ